MGQVGGVRRIGAGLAAFAMLVAGAAGQGSQEYVRAKAGAVLRNFQDVQGNEILRPDAGALLKVHEESRLTVDGREVIWLKVSAPAGLPVWVYGKYLEQTSVEGVLRVNASAVRMRPLPSSSVSSYPIRAQLSRGDRVEFIKRNDPSVAWAEDWARVWSPTEATVWVNAAQTTPEPDISAASAEWQTSLRVLPTPVVASTSRPAAGTSGTVKDDAALANAAAASAPTTSAAQDVVSPAASAQRAIPEEAYKSMAYGNTLLKNARALGDAALEVDFDRSIQAFNIVLDIAPAGSVVAVEASRLLLVAEVDAIAAAVREGLGAVEARRVRERDALQEKQAQAALAGTAHWGRFSGRGWVDSKTVGKRTTWYLIWGGEITFEIQCQSGRYDLAQFEGFEVGVKGSTIRGQSMATEEQRALVALLDVTRIEVISAGVRRR